MTLKVVLVLLGGSWVTTLAMLQSRGRWYGPVALAVGMTLTMMAVAFLALAGGSHE